MSNGNHEKQVSLAGAAKATGKESKPQKKKKSFPWGAVVAVVLVVALLVTGGVLLFGKEDGPSLTARDMVEYTVTPDTIREKVSYFALGVTGASATDRMDMVAVMWLDRKNGSAGVLQMPVATYIGKDTGFATTTLGDVWGNPQPETFCSTCRIRLEEADIQDGVHKTCGSAAEQRTGSAYGDLIRVFNDQYGLPIDNYLVISRAGLTEMIDLLGGVDVDLAEAMTLADVKYKAGVQTLSGAAAVDYAITDDYKNTPQTDIDRMARQRQVFAAIIQRFGACELEELYGTDKTTGAVKGVFGKLMLGENPVRFNSTSFGKARLLGVSENAANDLKLSAAIAKFAKQLGDLSLDKITFSVLPGKAMKSGTATVYSPHRAQTIELLKQQMNPYGLTLDENTVTVSQVNAEQEKGETTTLTLDTVAVFQSGMLTATTTAAKATTTTMAGGATQP
ncbi:MAG: LCP family protein [Clostridia bacterium]|nr:LCP family protein [Clostridia bacterium]